jgi:hypothetical protein
VIVDGVVRKRGGKMLADLDAARARVQASRDYLVEEQQRRAAAAAAQTAAQ